MKHLNVPFDDDTYQELLDVKDDRSWQDAICEEFGVTE
jgi:hypothetical protein